MAERYQARAEDQTQGPVLQQQHQFGSHFHTAPRAVEIGHSADHLKHDQRNQRHQQMHI